MNFIAEHHVSPSNCEAFWYKDSSVFAVIKTHIDYVINNSSLFNFDINDIRLIYKKYNEPFRFEGKARNEIMESLIKNGWVRIRKRKVHRNTLESTIIQFSDNTKEEEIFNFIYWGISMNVFGSNEHILLSNINKSSASIVSIIDNKISVGNDRRIHE